MKPKHIIVFDVEDDSRAVVERVAVRPAKQAQRPAVYQSRFDFCPSCGQLEVVHGSLCDSCASSERRAA